MATNRSPSPTSIRSQSPHPRTPEHAGGPRKIAGANQISSTTRKSTPDLPHRVSVSKGGAVPSSLRSSYEEKENERDSSGSSLIRARSPATPSLKGTKNFMAPTISATSKVISASPKRKILSERNEVVRSSLTSVSDLLVSVGSGEFDSKSGMGFRVPHVHSDTPEVLKPSAGRVREEESGLRTEMNSCPREVLGSFKLKKCDFEMSADQSAAAVAASNSLTPVIAPLDADPTLPPYDPETNFLSPRPQFLRYRPKPQTELYLNKEDDLSDLGYGKQLDDSFSSESCRDTSEKSEGTQSSDAKKDTEDDAFSSYSVEETGEIENQSGIRCPELTSDNTTHSREKSRLHSFSRSKLIPLVLLLVVASLSISAIDTPMISSTSMLNDQSFAKFYSPTLRVFRDPYVGGSLAKATELANIIRLWSAANIPHFPMLVSIPRGEELGLFQLINSTAAVEDRSMDLQNDYKQVNQESSVEVGMDDVKEEQMIKNVEMVGVSDSGKEEDSPPEPEAAADSSEENMVGDNEESGHLEHRLLDTETIVEEELKAENSQDHATETEVEASNIDSLGQIQPNFESQNGVEDALSGVELEAEKNHEVEASNLNPLIQFKPSFEEVHSGVEVEVGRNHDQPSTVQISESGISSTSSGPEEESRTSHIPKPTDFISLGPEEMQSLTILGLSSVVLALAAVLFSLYLGQKQASSVNHEMSPAKKVSSGYATGVSESHKQDQSPLYRNYPFDVETVHESGPSEMSSTFQNSASYSRKLSKRGTEEENLSYERRPRRDSTASSTSYGSLTVYEKLSGKKGDEAMTPVRRSSRIRSQLTSP